MNEYQDYPPQPYFEQILRNCPKCAEMYCQLWKEQNKTNNVKIPRSKIEEEYLMDYSKFLRCLRQLTREGLLGFKNINNIIHIDMTDWSVEFEAFGV